MAPADRKKEGSGLDLAILCSIFQCEGIIPKTFSFEDKCIIGELSLSGEVRPVPGVLCLTLAAREAGRKKIYVPMENAEEAGVVDGVEVYGVSSLRELVEDFRGGKPLKRTLYDKREFYEALESFDLDFADVKGQYNANRSL